MWHLLLVADDISKSMFISFFCFMFTVDTVGDILGSSCLFSSLLPLALAYAGPVAVQDPRVCVRAIQYQNKDKEPKP